MAVDAGLEQAIDAVESAVDDYRAAQTPDRRAALVAALGQVDELVELGDDFAQRSAAGLVGYGVSPRASATLSAFGARGPSSMAEEVPAAVLRAQIALVRCAKDVVRGTGPNAEAALGAAVEDLAHPDYGPALRRYLEAAPGISGEDRLRVLSLASDLTAGDFGGYQAVLAIHAEGSIEAEKLTILAQYDRAAATEYASWLAGLSDDLWPPRAPDAY